MWGPQAQPQELRGSETDLKNFQVLVEEALSQGLTWVIKSTLSYSGGS